MSEELGIIKEAERRSSIQPTVAQTYGEQMLDLINEKGIPPALSLRA